MAKSAETVREEMKELVAGMAAAGPFMLEKAPAEFALAVAEIAFAKGVNEGLSQATDHIAASLSR